MKKRKKTWNQKQLYLLMLMLPAVIVIFIFNYIPMYGIVMAFKDVRVGQSMFEGVWVGLKHFQRLFNSPMFWNIIKNTLRITLVQNIVLLPLPIIFALMIHNTTSGKIRKFSQTVSYLPHMISMVVIVYIVDVFCNLETGLINNVLVNVFNKDAINILGDSEYYYPVYYISHIWATLGSSAVIYIAALAGVDEQLVEAAMIDGASKLQRMWHIDLPSIKPTIVILLVMNVGNALKVGYEKTLLLQNDLNLEVSETIATYVYKTGLVSAQYSFSSAVNLFQNLVGLLLVLLCNYFAKKFSEASLF